MSAWLLGLAQRYGLVALQGLAIVGTVLAVVLGLRNAGRNAEKVEQMKQALEGVHDAEKTRREVRETHGRGAVPERVRKFYIDE